MSKLLAAFAMLITLTACSQRVDNIKIHADAAWRQAGFEVVGYEGYQYGLFNTFGGCVWYTVKRAGITYDGCVSQWGDEFHIYSIHALGVIGVVGGDK